MTTKKPTNILRRYTEIPALLHILKTCRISLLDPRSWDDRNDALFLALYKERQALKTVLALCFSYVPETYHHWHVFARGPAGICIEFDRRRLLAAVRTERGIRTEEVTYLTLREARRRQLVATELPFLKRAGYRPEGESRLVWESARHEKSSHDIALALDCVRSVSLSPWLSSNVSGSVVDAIRSVSGCESLTVSRSTLISNEEWKAFGRNAICPQVLTGHKNRVARLGMTPLR